MPSSQMLHLTPRKLAIILATDTGKGKPTTTTLQGIVETCARNCCNAPTDEDDEEENVCDDVVGMSDNMITSLNNAYGTTG